MPITKRQKPLYQRGRYSLHRRDGRTNLEIVWYDEARKRERSQSAATGDLGKASLALDRLYLNDTDHRVCPTCHRAWDHAESPLLITAISDYLILSEGKAGIKSARNRLGHVSEYVLETDENVTCAAIDQRFVESPPLSAANDVISAES